MRSSSFAKLGPRTRPSLPPRSLPGERVSRFVGQTDERPGRPRLGPAFRDRDLSERYLSSLSVQKPVQTAARNSSGTTRSVRTTASTLPGKTWPSLCHTPLHRDAHACLRKALDHLTRSTRAPLAFSLGASAGHPPVGRDYGSHRLPEDLPKMRRLCRLRCGVGTCGVVQGRGPPVQGEEDEAWRGRSSMGPEVTAAGRGAARQRPGAPPFREHFGCRSSGLPPRLHSPSASASS